MRLNVRDRCLLAKIPVSVMSACAALFGYAACVHTLPWKAFAAALGVFFLAGGAAALNNYQDRHTDLMMERTRLRPLPDRRLPAAQALLQAGMMMIIGVSVLIWSTGKAAAPLAGLAATALYNAVYTPMKKKTRLALVPGVICGMLPPLIGWLAAGGGLRAPGIWYIMVLFGVWQVPHFSLLLLSRQAEYRRSTLPTMLDILSNVQLGRLVFVWTASYAVLTLFMRFFNISLGLVVMLLLALNALGVLLVFVRILTSSLNEKTCTFLFRYLSAAMIMIMLLVIVSFL